MPNQYLDLVQFLATKSVAVVGSIVGDNSDDEIFVRVAVERDKDNRQQPSNRTLAAIKDELLQHGYRVEFLLTDALGHDVEGGLRATLIYAFGNEVRNVFLSLNGREANVWFEPKRTLDEQVSRAIKSRAQSFLSDVGISLATFETTGDENVPGKLACLRALRRIAPASLDMIKSELQRRNFVIPSDDWLKRRLDALRKAGKVVWHAGDKYSCTLATIHSLGTVKGRRSPDLERLLALARRGR